MKKNAPKNRYVSAAIAGVLAGSALLAAPARGDDKPNASKTPAASPKDKNACGGPNGCGSKKTSPSDADKHACKGQNACKGHGGCKSGDNGCAARNSCKGKGGCATPAKPEATPAPKAA